MGVKETVTRTEVGNRSKGIHGKIGRGWHAHRGWQVGLRATTEIAVTTRVDVGRQVEVKEGCVFGRCVFGLRLSSALSYNGPKAQE